MDLIARNPFIEQSEIAAQLNVARSTVAVQISHLVSKGAVLGRGYILPAAQRVTCIGGIAYNRKFSLDGKADLGTSNPAKGSQSYGGVARNIAETLARLDVDVSIISIIGNDPSGAELLEDLRSLGIDTTQIAVSHSHKTAEYVAVFDASNDLVLGVASMDIFEDLTAERIARSQAHITSSDWVVLDCNLPSQAIAKVFDLKHSAGFQVAIDTVSVSKAKRLPSDLCGIDLLFTNRSEARSILDDSQMAGAPDAAFVAHMLRDRGAQGVIVTDGAAGHVVNIGDQSFRTPALSKDIVDVSGAGDALIAGFLYALRSGMPLVEASFAGAAASSLTVESSSDVRPDLTAELLTARIRDARDLTSEDWHDQG